jgi:DNA-directed RNA polymerase specialized sigma24 family protein
MSTTDEATSHTMEQQHEAAARPATKWDQGLIARAWSSAAFAARKAGRRRGWPPAAQDDLRQDILLAVLARADRYDAQRGAQSTFLKIVTHAAVVDHTRAARTRMLSDLAPSTPEDIAAPEDPEERLLQRIALARVLAELPPSHLRIVRLIAECGSAAEAHRASDQPLRTFYRQLRELRMRLRLAGLSVTP